MFIGESTLFENMGNCVVIAKNFSYLIGESSEKILYY